MNAPHTSSPRIALLGEALIDAFPDGDVLGGAPFNVARNLAALGEPPLLVTRVGQDARGGQIDAEFRRFGMSTAGLQRDPSHPTGVVQVHMQGRSHRFEIGLNQAWDHIDAAAACEVVRAAQPGLVYFGTLAQRDPGSRQAIRAVLEATPAHRFLDLNLREGPDNQGLAADSLALAQSVKVNDEELDELLRWFVHPGQPAAAWGEPAHQASVAALMRRFTLQRLVVTRGGQGWGCFETAGEGTFTQGTAPAVTVRDTVGAGDAFASVLLLGEVRGWPLSTTLPRASRFAAAVCTVQGAVDTTGAIYQAALREWAAQDA